jgi:ATP-dependent Clp protease adaptor protein ClpS
MANEPIWKEEGDAAVTVKPARKLHKPPLYRVILHNDDFTTMDFVIYLLQTVFRHSESESVRIMWAVHHTGNAVAGVYPFEIAESKAARAMDLARRAEYPLLCSVEPE